MNTKITLDWPAYALRSTISFSHTQAYWVLDNQVGDEHLRVSGGVVRWDGEWSIDTGHGYNAMVATRVFEYIISLSLYISAYAMAMSTTATTDAAYGRMEAGCTPSRLSMRATTDGDTVVYKSIRDLLIDFRAAVPNDA